MTEDEFDYDPFSLQVRNNPYPIYAQLRDQHPIYHSRTYDFWALSRFADVQQASRNWRLFSNSKGVDLDHSGVAIYGAGELGNFLDSDPPVHTGFRKLMQPAFLPAKLSERLAPEVHQVVHALLDRLGGRGEVDLIADFAWLLPTTVMWRWLGCPESDFPVLRELLRRVKFREIGIPHLTAVASEALSELREYMRSLTVSRQREPTEDLISYILQEGRDSYRSDLIEVTLNISMLMVDAGTGTTAALLGNALYLLATNPKQREELLRQPDKIGAAVEEAIRLESPVQHNARTTTGAVDLYGHHLPENSRVLLIYGAANRDDHRWQDADVFDVDRRALPHLGFGHGIHLCLGAPLARLEATVALAEFLRRFPCYEIGDGAIRLPNLDRGFLALPARL